MPGMHSSGNNKIEFEEERRTGSFRLIILFGPPTLTVALSRHVVSSSDEEVVGGVIGGKGWKSCVPR